MADVHISCINKTPRDDTHHGITHLGNSQGRWTRAQVTQWIISKEHSFFTMVKRKWLGNLFQIAPAAIAALLGAAAGIDMLVSTAPAVWAKAAQALGVISAVIAAVGNVLNPFAEYADHIAAAKGFTILKHDARSLRETFSAAMSDDTFVGAVKSLRDRYADLVRSAPETDPESFEEKTRRQRNKL